MSKHLRSECAGPGRWFQRQLERVLLWVWDDGTAAPTPQANLPSQARGMRAGRPGRRPGGKRPITGRHAARPVKPDPTTAQTSSEAAAATSDVSVATATQLPNHGSDMKQDKGEDPAVRTDATSDWVSPPSRNSSASPSPSRSQACSARANAGGQAPSSPASTAEHEGHSALVRRDSAASAISTEHATGPSAASGPTQHASNVPNGRPHVSSFCHAAGSSKGRGKRAAGKRGRLETRHSGSSQSESARSLSEQSRASQIGANSTVGPGMPVKADAADPHGDRLHELLPKKPADVPFSPPESPHRAAALRSSPASEARASGKAQAADTNPGAHQQQQQQQQQHPAGQNGIKSVDAGRPGSGKSSRSGRKKKAANAALVKPAAAVQLPETKLQSSADEHLQPRDGLLVPNRPAAPQENAKMSRSGSLDSDGGTHRQGQQPKASTIPDDDANPAVASGLDASQPKSRLKASQESSAYAANPSAEAMSSDDLPVLKQLLQHLPAAASEADEDAARAQPGSRSLQQSTAAAPEADESSNEATAQTTTQQETKPKQSHSPTTPAIQDQRDPKSCQAAQHLPHLLPGLRSQPDIMVRSKPVVSTGKPGAVSTDKPHAGYGRGLWQPERTMSGGMDAAGLQGKLRSHRPQPRHIQQVKDAAGYQPWSPASASSCIPLDPSENPFLVEPGHQAPTAATAATGKRGRLNPAPDTARPVQSETPGLVVNGTERLDVCCSCENAAPATLLAPCGHVVLCR